ncbi:MAG: hypothetical protein AAGA80_18670 [Cyanobacteria bacterium P01_F01_bin.143]
MTARLYTATETTAIREKIINYYALPIVKKVFAKYPRIRSAYFAVAQYWDDNASDQVHYFILYSVLDIPNWEAYVRSENKEDPKGCKEWSDLDWDNYFDIEIKDCINLPDISEWEYMELITDEEWEKLENSSDFYDFNGLTHEMVTAFAPFCKEGCHQDMDYGESYTNYALFTRMNTGIKIKIVGKMLRPWLDGIRPEANY